MSVRKNSAAFKAKVALTALTSDKTRAELCSEFGVHQTQINKWKRELKDGAVGVFNGEAKSDEVVIQKKLHEFHAKISQLTMERDFLADALSETVSISRRQQMVQPEKSQVSVVRQCSLLTVSQHHGHGLLRGSF